MKTYRMFGCCRQKQEWVFCVNHTANGVRIDVGRLYDGQDWKSGWKKALKEGCRVVPVWVSRRRQP